MVRHPVPKEGRFAIVTNAGRDAVDVDAPVTKVLKRTAKSCGPDIAVLVSSSRKPTFANDGGKRAVHRGEHAISRKTIAQGMPDCLR
jgi:hypothetical protein